MAEVDIKIVTGELVRRLNEDERRIRILEQRIEKTDMKLSELAEMELSQTNNLNTKLDLISNKISNVVERIKAIDEEIVKIKKEMVGFITKSEVKELQMFVDLINPITSKFVTREEMEIELENRLGKKT